GREPLPAGHVLHIFRDHPAAGIVHLGEVLLAGAGCFLPAARDPLRAGLGSGAKTLAVDAILLDLVAHFHHGPPLTRVSKCAIIRRGNLGDSLPPRTFSTGETKSWSPAGIRTRCRNPERCEGPRMPNGDPVRRDNDPRTQPEIRITARLQACRKMRTTMPASRAVRHQLPPTSLRP